VLLRKIDRAYEAFRVGLGVEAERPIDLEELRQAINALIAMRIPVFTNFSTYIPLPGGLWTKLIVKYVEPREPAYITNNSNIYLG